jgi:phosphoribosyl 1,2-cyclic phosphate phosphodiesterase
MNYSGTVTLLGTGASLGIPVIGCHCAVCQSSDPHNRRLRSAALVCVEAKKFLIDAGPDLRMQALRWEINTLDGVLFTHAHQDHTAGIDDLRVYHMRTKKPLPCLLSAATLDEIKMRFNYLFIPPIDKRLHFVVLPKERGEIVFEGLRVRYFTYTQTGMAVNGFRLGDFAYVSDIREYPKTIFDDLKGVRQLVISALRWESSHIHLTVDEAVAFAESAGVQHAYLTHLSHDLDHERTNAKLPQNVRMGYDGMVIDFHPDL